MSKNLNSKTKTGIIWDLSGAFVRQFAFLFISIILARLLEPEQFGIIGMSMVFVAISQVFTDVGFTAGLIQQKDTKDITFSSVFYINMAISILLSVVILLTAPLIAKFYKEPIVATMLYYLSVIPPIAALGRVQAAILTKRVDFKSLTIRDLVATIIGGILGVTAAYSDFGVYSLVIQQIAMVITATIMLWFATGWQPKLEFSIDEIKKLFGYSSYVFFDSLMRQVFNKIDTIFIAKVFSPATLGFYSRAESLKSQVQSYTTTSLNKVIFPVLSQLQDDIIEFNTTYFRANNIVTGLIILIIAPLYFLAHFIIIFLLGDKWEPSVILFQYLILSIITGPQGAIMGKALLAKGYSKFRFKIGLIQRVIKLSPIATGLFYGIEEFALAMVLASVLVFLMFLIVLDMKLNISFWKQLKNFIKPNIIFFIFISIHAFFKNEISPWLIASTFFVIHIFYIKIIEHESYVFITNNATKYIRKLKRN